MKKAILLLLILTISFPLATAFSFGDFFSDFFIFTGMAVLEIKEERLDNSEKFKKISVPELKKIEVEEEIKEDSEKINQVEEVVEKSSENKKSKKKFIPECSDYLDNNVNYLKKGICNDNTRKILREDSSEDYCSEDGITLMEYFCNSDNICESSWYVCQNGCGEGACLTERIEEFKPDLKVLSVGNNLYHAVISVKNRGSKGTYFKTKISNVGVEKISNVNYYLEPGETINVELKNKILGDYSIELLVEDDLNQEDNKFSGNLKEIKREPEITGKVTSSQKINKDSSLTKFFKFLRTFF